MMKSRRWIALAGAALMFATTAWGQTQVQDGKPLNNIIYKDGVPYRTESVLIPVLVGGVARADTTSRAFTMDAGGNLMIKDAAPVTSVLYKYTQAINNRLVSGNRDSSLSLNVLGAKHIYLMITVTPDSNTCSSLWALQIRRHHDSFTDTVSTWPMLPINSDQIINGANSPLNDAATIAGSAVDTIGSLARPGAVVDTALIAGERAMAFAQTIGGTKSTSYSFEIFEGNRPFTAQRMSVRVRQVKIFGTPSCLTTTNTRSATIRVDVVGTL